MRREWQTKVRGLALFKSGFFLCFWTQRNCKLGRGVTVCQMTQSLTSNKSMTSQYKILLTRPRTRWNLVGFDIEWTAAERKYSIFVAVIVLTPDVRYVLVALWTFIQQISVVRICICIDVPEESNTKNKDNSLKYTFVYNNCLIEFWLTLKTLPTLINRVYLFILKSLISNILW